MRYWIYGVMIACYLAAGTMDLMAGDKKSGVVAWMFAGCNAVIFFWRT